MKASVLMRPDCPDCQALYAAGIALLQGSVGGSIGRPCCDHHLVNPWAGRVPCPACGSSDWTLPWVPGEPFWHCCADHTDFRVKSLAGMAAKG